MNRKGFTLIELMVVVAIIGILSSIAVPQFRRFQAKAKQSNAKAELSGIYMAESTFQTEFGGYSSRLASIGYIPAGFGNETCPDVSSVPAGVTRYYTTGFSEADGIVPSNIADFDACDVVSYPASVPPDGDLSSSVITTSTFTAAAIGNVYGGSLEDEWTMNQNKQLLNVVVGLSGGSTAEPDETPPEE